MADPYRALWMFFEPDEARGAREILKLSDDANFAEVRSKMATANARDRSEIVVFQQLSSSGERYTQLGSKLIFNPPRRDNWKAFVATLDAWSRKLIDKITALATKEATAQISGKQPDHPAKQPDATPPLNRWTSGPTM